MQHEHNEAMTPQFCPEPDSSHASETDPISSDFLKPTGPVKSQKIKSLTDYPKHVHGQATTITICPTAQLLKRT